MNAGYTQSSGGSMHAQYCELTLGRQGGVKDESLGLVVVCVYWSGSRVTDKPSRKSHPSGDMPLKHTESRQQWPAAYAPATTLYQARQQMGTNGFSGPGTVGA